MLVRFWCKFGATLYRAILTIFTISNGTLKTPRDNLRLTAIISIYKKLCFGRAFCFVIGWDGLIYKELSSPIYLRLIYGII